MKGYTKPGVILTELEADSVLCISIQTMNFTVDVDEYENMCLTDETLVFDSD